MSIAGSLSPTTSGGGLSGTLAQNTKLTQTQFFKVLVAQLTQQDPMNPTDSKDFLGQLVQLQNLQVTSDLSNNFGGMLSQNAFSSASLLLGRVIQGSATDGTPVNGQVSRVSIDGGNVNLQVGTYTVPLKQVTQIEENPLFVAP